MTTRYDQIDTRLSLLGRLGDWRDHDSWRLFFDTYAKLIFNFAVQRGLSRQEAEEAVQETILAVAKYISQFNYQPSKCSFRTWLLTIARSKIADQIKRRPRTDGSFDPEPVHEVQFRTGSHNDWEIAWLNEWKNNLLLQATERVKQIVSIEQFQMFDLFVVKGWTAREVANTLKVSIGHVYVAKHRIAKLLRKTVRELEADGM